MSIRCAICNHFINEFTGEWQHSLTGKRACYGDPAQGVAQHFAQPSPTEHARARAWWEVAGERTVPELLDAYLAKNLRELADEYMAFNGRNMASDWMRQQARRVENDL